MRFTDMADEMFGAAQGRCLPGKACHSKARRGHNNAGGDRARRAGEAPRTVCHAGNAQRQRAGRAGRCGDRDLCGRTARPAAAGRAGVGAGHREPAGHGGCPRPAHGAEDFSHHGAAAHAAGKGIRPVAAIAPVSASTGLTLRQLAGAMVEAVRPAALICVDSLCSAEGARLGRSVQFSDTVLYPAQADHAKHLTRQRWACR